MALDAKKVLAMLDASKADLVDGKVPSDELPSYVDDVVEYASQSAFPTTGESGKIYVALDTNKTYRWSGTTYIQIGGGSDTGGTFVATYGTTTAAEVATALTAGKAVICTYEDAGNTVHQLLLSEATNGKYGFTESSVATSEGVTYVAGISAALNISTNEWEAWTGSGTMEQIGRLTINNIPYLIQRKALSITDSGVTTNYYVADITSTIN